MEHLRCVVERITYQNAENRYTVLKVAVKGAADLVTVVGLMPDTHVGSVLSLEGFWKMDARYGRQFSLEKFEETLPATVYGIEKYLGSGLVKGVGPKFARRIVEKFGKDTLDVIEEEPDRLLQRLSGEVAQYPKGACADRRRAAVCGRCDSAVDPETDEIRNFEPLTCAIRAHYKRKEPRPRLELFPSYPGQLLKRLPFLFG